MLHMGAGHTNNSQIIPKLFGYDIFCNDMQLKTISSKFGGIRGINHLRYKQGKARVMLDIGAGHTNNSQIIPKLFGYDIFCKDLQQKQFQANLEVSEVLISYFTNRGKARVMLHTGAGHTNNSQIIPKLFGYDIFCNDLQQENNFKQIWRHQRY